MLLCAVALWLSHDTAMRGLVAFAERHVSPDHRLEPQGITQIADLFFWALMM